MESYIAIALGVLLSIAVFVISYEWWTHDSGISKCIDENSKNYARSDELLRNLVTHYKHN